LTAAEVETIEKSIEERAAARQAEAAEAAKDAEGRKQRSTEQGKRLYAMYLLAVNAGLRTIEISRANVKDLEVKQGAACLYIWGKGHSEPDQKKPIAPAVYEAIREYLEARADHPTGASPLFVSTGNRSGGARIAPTTISTMLKRAMQAAGFDSERLTAHSLRHTAGQNVMQITGENIYQTQLYMRHSNPTTTEIYLDNSTAAQNAALAERLYKHYHGGDEPQTAAGKLQEAMQAMTPAQLDQLAQIAAAMASK
jgi:integrase/recombinase XerC